MSLTINLSPATETKLRERAAASGEEVTTYVERLVENTVAKPTLAEVLAPIREEFEQSGMTDDELSDLLEEAKHERRAERRKARQS